MSERPKLNSPNSFCWIELACHSMPAAKEFYGSVLGWKFKDTKAAGGVYSSIKTSKGLVGGLYEFVLPDEPKKKKKEPQIPSFWGSYVSTKNVEATTRKAEKLGGVVVADVTDLGDTGYMSVIQDPAGALFGLWQAKKLEGFGPSHEDTGAAGWNELITPDLKASQDFYTKLFGWKVSKSKFNDQDYIIFTLDKKRVAGMMEMNSKHKNMPPHWLIYFNVNDCDKSTKLAVENGAKLVYSPTNVKGAGRLSVMSDAEGAVFALIKYDPK